MCAPQNVLFFFVVFGALAMVCGFRYPIHIFAVEIAETTTQQSKPSKNV